ncbi:methylmalonyl-CoA mutase [candidate division LCP-89 bacterium B3_LCP]|uniref:Methylmalonyl-CoA mutase n=1 Tax=candidate division LCP-89 bacterium B3_LCP TaxID=2012998 RepID=A0A532UVW5_UNCL8|nr:MAG: methylmalonyl-CoA mutase [candidate division LCP-89 bacterium B3_LCP]
MSQNRSKISPLKSAFAEWKTETLSKFLQKVKERRGIFSTDSDIPVERLYVPESHTEADYLEQIGFPGEYPFTRGVYPTMYRGRFWTMRQYAGFGSAEESNQRYHYLLNQGQTGLSVAFDLPTQIGYDSDHPLAEGEVGKVGVAICSLADMEVLFKGIKLDQVSTSMTINATAGTLLALYVAIAKKQGAELGKLSGTIQNDILKEYIARGTYIYPPKPSMRLITDVFAWCKENLPAWNTISISGYHIREAGSTAVQEVAFTLSNGIAYVKAALDAGLEVDQFAPRLAFFFNSHNNLFEEIAKFRAARRIWAKIMKNRFEARNPRSLMLRFHTQTAGSTLTAQQPDNNVIRVTMQALAAALGGTQSLHTNSRDEALGLPTEDSAQIALRTQQIIAHESGVTDTVDPLAGSYFIEELTDQIERKVEELIDKIDAMGGSVQGIEQGIFQREIAASAYQTQKEIESEDKIVVGVNAFKAEAESPQEMLEINPQVAASQRLRLAKLRAERDNSSVNQILTKLMTAAKGSENLMPVILEAVERHATLGEISDSLRQVWGEYQGDN